MTNGPPATVSVLLVEQVVLALERLGLDADQALERAGLTRALLGSPHGRLPIATEIALWQAAVEISGDASIGLRLAEQIRPGALGSFDYLLRHSESLEELIARAQRYGRLVDEAARLHLSVEQGVATVRLGRRLGVPVHAAAIECLFAICVATVRRAFPGARALDVRFTHAHRDLERYRQHFDCPVYFEADANEIRCDAALLKRATRHADPKLGRVLEEHTQHLLSQLPRTHSVTDRARHELERLLGSGSVQLEALAQALHMSERTLRRRLKAEGTSYQALLDEQRRLLALARVKVPALALEQLAAELGFSDASTFFRAFKRWTGTTPAQYRARKS